MKKLLLLSPLLVVMGCASAIQGSTQQVNLQISGASSANCTSTSKEHSQQFSAPGMVNLQRSYYPSNIVCTAPDGQRGEAKVLSDVSGWGYGGAVLGLGVGAGVDTYTGAAFKYPENITIVMGETLVLGKTSMNSNVDWE